MQMPRIPLLLGVALAVAVAGRPAAAQPPTVVVLVRHAEKALGGTSHDPPLTRAGEARARALVDALASTRVDAIITTQYRRTRDTAAPLAAARRITPEVVDVHQGDQVTRIAQSVRTRHAGQVVLVVAHAETVARIIAALGGPRLPDLCDTEYANLFVLVLRPGHEPALVRSRYGAPDRDARNCR
ncbi:MAG TPA: phosphoglycerate mutase family protein [Longimicrobium sp.]|jgi:broad specificity phosphatase PhoE|nr:phosphoglycerate mutase family protein [Longimicrobium sp.]